MLTHPVEFSLAVYQLHLQRATCNVQFTRTEAKARIASLVFWHTYVHTYQDFDQAGSRLDHSWQAYQSIISMSHPSRPPPSPPSPPSPLSLSARVLLPAPAPAPALVSASASASSKQPSGCEALAHPHCHLHPSSQSVVTPPDSFREPSSSPINECECEREQHEEHQHKHNYQTQNIIQHLRRLQDGRVHSLHSWHVFPLSHHELLALHDSIETEGATLAAYFYDKVRYDYFYFWQQFVLRMPLLASHEIVIRDIDAEIVAQLRAKTSPTQARALKSLGSKTYDLPDDPQQGRDSGCNSHSPDASFGLAGEQYPGVVLEVANTQKAKFLDQIADDYIVGSEGHVRVVVAIMFNYGSSEKATLSIWRSTVAQNAEGQWEHFCQNTMREMVCEFLSSSSSSSPRTVN